MNTMNKLLLLTLTLFSAPACASAELLDATENLAVNHAIFNASDLEKNIAVLKARYPNTLSAYDVNDTRSTEEKILADAQLWRLRLELFLNQHPAYGQKSALSDILWHDNDKLKEAIKFQGFLYAYGNGALSEETLRTAWTLHGKLHGARNILRQSDEFIQDHKNGLAKQDAQAETRQETDRLSAAIKAEVEQQMAQAQQATVNK